MSTFYVLISFIWVLWLWTCKEHIFWTICIVCSEISLLKEESNIFHSHFLCPFCLLLFSILRALLACQVNANDLR